MRLNIFLQLLNFDYWRMSCVTLSSLLFFFLLIEHIDFDLVFSPILERRWQTLVLIVDDTAFGSLPKSIEDEAKKKENRARIQRDIIPAKID